jgi:hypothetical protein
LSSPLSPETSSTTSPSVSICVSSMSWRVQRRRRSDQPIAHTSPPRPSPSIRLPPIEHRAAAASPLRSAAPQLWSTLPACDAPSKSCMSLVASHHCIDLRPAAPRPRAAASLHAVTFAIPRALTFQATTVLPHRRGSPPSAHGLRQAAGFFLAYSKYRRHTSTGNLHDHFWSSQASPTTSTV